MNKQTVVGVFSGVFGANPNPCARPTPNIYTNVLFFMDYINSELTYYTQRPFEAGINPAAWLIPIKKVP